MRNRPITQGHIGTRLFFLLTSMDFFFLLLQLFWTLTRDNRWRISKKLLCLAITVRVRISLKQISQRKSMDGDSRHNNLLR